MKIKLPLSILLTLSIYSVYSQTENFKLNPYLGLIPFDPQTASIVLAHYGEEGSRFIGSPVSLGIKLDIPSKKDVNFFVDLNYSHTGYRFKVYDHFLYNEDGDLITLDEIDWKAYYSNTRVMFGFYKKFNTDKVKSGFEYASIAAGYKHKRVITMKNDINQPNSGMLPLNSYYNILTRAVAFRLALGKYWEINDRTSFMMEVGLGGGRTPLSFGISYTL